MMALAVSASPTQVVDIAATNAAGIITPLGVTNIAGIPAINVGAPAALTVAQGITGLTGIAGIPTAGIIGIPGTTLTQITPSGAIVVG